MTELRILSQSVHNQGRWQVWAEWPKPGAWTVVFDPDNGPGWEWLDLKDCIEYRENFEKSEIDSYEKKSAVARHSAATCDTIPL